MNFKYRALTLGCFAAMGLAGTAHAVQLAGDLLELGVAQLQAIAAAKDFGALLSQQAALTNAFVAKSTTRSQEAVQLATAAQGEFTAWMSATTSELGRKAT